MARRNSSHLSAVSQPDLFAFVPSAEVNVPRQKSSLKSAGSNAKVQLPPEVSKADPVPTQRAKKAPEAPALRITTVSEMPAYPELDQELVDRSICALPPNRMWFTYAAIRESFGISRATVARKVKLGLVPGIRFRGASVIEDGPVRRFDRGQLRWLLLAVRFRH